MPPGALSRTSATAREVPRAAPGRLGLAHHRDCRPGVHLQKVQVLPRQKRIVRTPAETTEAPPTPRLGLEIRALPGPAQVQAPGARRPSRCAGLPRSAILPRDSDDSDEARRRTHPPRRPIRVSRAAAQPAGPPARAGRPASRRRARPPPARSPPRRPPWPVTAVTASVTRTRQ